jgi:hypothetical protein
MLEPSTNRTLAHALQAGLFGWTLSLATITQAGAAEALPASVRACSAETDRERRLDCFDREVARFPDSKATAQAARSQPAAPPSTSASTTSASPPAPATSVSPAQARSAAPAPVAAPVTSAAPAASAAQTAVTQPGANTASTSASTSAADAPAKRKTDSATKPGRIAARVISIDRSPNEMVLHLDNGQVWEQLQSVAGDLSLKAGDNIAIDKRLGSYWLTGPHVSGMKVRQRS